jgi:hypothetical protein
MNTTNLRKTNKTDTIFNSLNQEHKSKEVKIIKEIEEKNY